MRCLRFAAGLVAVIALLSACFQVETTVRVNADGSGTIEDKMLMSQKVIAQMDEMAKAMGGTESKSEPFSLYDPKKLRAQAATLGEGVAFVSAEPVREVGYAGYRAVYSFSDINKVQLSRRSPATESEPSGSKAASPGGSRYVFSFTRGAASRLVITSADRGKPADPPKEEAGQKAPVKEERKATPEQEREMMEMFKGMKFSLKIEVNGTVKESNATHRDGSRITLYDFDLDRLGADAGKLMRLKDINPADLAEAKKILKEFPGFSVDLNERLEVVFTR